MEHNRNFSMTPETIAIVKELSEAMTAATGEKPNESAALRKIIREWAHEHAYHPDGTFNAANR